MNENSEAPSAWRLLWSPKAMAWWARYRPSASLRIGTVALAMAWGTFGVAVLDSIDEPFGEPAGLILQKMISQWVVLIALGHAWSWFIPSTKLQNKQSQTWIAAVLISSLPGMIIMTTDGLLSMYREAVNYASLSPINPAWPALPYPLEKTTLTCMWFFIGLLLWGAFGFFSTRYYSALPDVCDPNACSTCGYDLRGTRAAGIERCSECGAAVEALAGNQSSIS